MSFLDILKEAKGIQTESFRDIFRGTNPCSKTIVFHISDNNSLNNKILHPRLPSYMIDKKGNTKIDMMVDMASNGLPENYTIPRVCFSPSINGALNAITNYDKLTKFHMKEFYVYIPEKPLKEYNHLTNKEIIDNGYVFDANYTKEVWILEDVKLKLYGTIIIDGVRYDTKKHTVGHTDRYCNYLDFKWRWFVPPKVLNIWATEESSTNILTEADKITAQDDDNDTPTDYSADVDTPDDTESDDASTDTGDTESQNDDSTEDNTDNAEDTGETPEDDEDKPTDYTEEIGEIETVPIEPVDGEESGEGSEEETSQDENTNSEETSEEDGDNNSSLLSLMDDFLSLYEHISINMEKLDKIKSLDMITSQVISKVKDNMNSIMEYIYTYVRFTFKLKTYADNLYVYNYLVQLYKICVQMLYKINNFSDAT